jgi:hypothetical protein
MRTNQKDESLRRHSQRDAALFSAVPCHATRGQLMPCSDLSVSYWIDVI